jgi:hypothetical protein
MSNPANNNIWTPRALGVSIVFPDVSQASTHMTMHISTCTNGHLHKLDRPRHHDAITLEQGHRFGV